MRYPLTLKAGQPAKQPFRGKSLLIVNPGASGLVDLTVYAGSEQVPSPMGTVPRYFSLYAPENTFTGAEFLSTVDTTIEFIVADFELRANDGSSVTATIDAAQLPLSVKPTRGDAPANALFVSGVTLDSTPAASNANAAAVAVGPAAVQVAAASAVVLQRRFANVGAFPCALGAAGLAWAQRVIVLNPGDTWTEDKGAALAWYAITDAGLSASVTVQELRA